MTAVGYIGRIRWRKGKSGKILISKIEISMSPVELYLHRVATDLSDSK